MISYQIIEHGKPLQKVLLETPKPQGSEVLVRITRSGVCHSDLHIWDGYFDLGGGKRFYVKERGCVPPFTLGHEPFGIVEALGPRAKGVKVGQKRIVYPWIGCGKCAVCKAGQDNYCVSGIRFLGVSRARRLLDARSRPGPEVPGRRRQASTRPSPQRSPAPASPRIAPPPSCRRSAPQDRVAVLGCGGLGLIGISVLRAKGVKKIVACDIDDAKLAAATKQGAKITVNTRAGGRRAEAARHRRRDRLRRHARRPRRSASPRCARAGVTCSAASTAASSCIRCRRSRSAPSASSAPTSEICRS